MSNPLIAKLSCAVDLSAADREVLEAVSLQRRKVPAGEQIIGQGDRPDRVHLVLEGICCRAKTLINGQRQIVALLLPGDFCDLHVAVLGEMDHAIRALTPCTMVQISRETVAELITGSPAMVQALWWATLVDEAVLREWLVNMGQRPAEQQMAHFFCELLVRLRVVGLTDGDSYSLPLTQEELADVLGLSIVHVNRVLQRLRSDGLIEWRRSKLIIPAFDRLAAFANFDPKYLHLEGNKAPALAPGLRSA